MIYVFLVSSAALTLILDKLFPIFKESYSLWLVPTLFLGLFLLLCILFIGVFVLLLLPVRLNKKVKCGSFLRGYSTLVLGLLFSLLRVSVKVEGREKLPIDKRFVLVCNHTHLFDPAALMVGLPEAELGFLGKREITKNMSLVAKFMYINNGAFVDRDSLRDSAAAIMSLIKLIKEDRASIGIFPEGHRSPDGNIGPFKAGAFKIAEKTKVPVAVCKISGVTEIMHPLFLKRHTVNVKIISVLESTDYNGLTCEEISEKVRNEMLNN